MTIQTYSSQYTTASRRTRAKLDFKANRTEKFCKTILFSFVFRALLLLFMSLLMPQMKSQVTNTLAPRPWDQNTDVVIIYKGDAGYLSNDEKTALAAYIKRGGGLASIHDSLCGPDPAYFATLVGGGKKHGEVNYTLGAPIPYTVVDTANPIMKGMSNITIFDEAFYNMTWTQNPSIHVLATAVIPGTPSAGAHKGEVVPQIWTYEHTLSGGQPARAFVWMQGHEYANFSNYQIQQMLLRGIAWAAKKPVDTLVDYVPQHPSRTQSPATNQ